MAKTIRIRKGLDINLTGASSNDVQAAPKADVYALRPPNFHGVIPKMLVKAGEQVKAGQPLFYAKGNESIKFCSPVSGEL
ncbi:MAG: NADH:ubiquinone reductase (Na(+)-transporting) subunit A, partial [Flavobacteriales bacterium]|nr:NADH:ubiquinone reductase (Na(+)-transporting) subunit A [Flavobacteriales bacterium]